MQSIVVLVVTIRKQELCLKIGPEDLKSIKEKQCDDENDRII